MRIDLDFEVEVGSIEMVLVGPDKQRMEKSLGKVLLDWQILR